MADAMHPAAPHYLPAFITAPGETDVLLVASVVLLTVLVFVFGSLYFWLHSMPERIAHGTNKLQFQLVAVLCLLALFTHITAFWIAALLLALIPIPDFWTPLANMAESLARMADRRPPDAAVSEPVSARSVAAVTSPLITAVAVPVPLVSIGGTPSTQDIESSSPPVATEAKERRALSTEGA